ncbi:MAG TPA: hypothetical protein VEI97_13065 [bacterium]|nr:hypothetical protein [bacterium]
MQPWMPWAVIFSVAALLWASDVTANLMVEDVHAAPAVAYVQDY